MQTYTYTYTYTHTREREKDRYSYAHWCGFKCRDPDVEPGLDVHTD